ncbi:MAG: SDR family NAD(P)-dependent oxidoreductase [Candidatus Accumulibacter sp.]|jgi:NAD(P)-dependent dehydrogenase (short-subunit alcohol dehydrogenase family)|nr:SDR family NAD(P)-dependent oxidoreductase [Accumulibacter sp.]
MSNEHDKTGSGHAAPSRRRRELLKAGAALALAPLAARAGAGVSEPSRSTAPKVWLVTGAGRGLGRAIAEAVLAAGDRLLATVRKLDHVAALGERYGSDRFRAVVLDVADTGKAKAAVQTAIDGFGRLDVLVNNAGFAHFAPFEQTPDDDFEYQIDTCFYGVVYFTRAALPLLRAQRAGRIINISSVGGRIGSPGLAAYQSAKWAVSGFSEVLAQEAAPFGVKVTAVEPGSMRTDWARTALSQVPELLPDYAAGVRPMRDILAQLVDGSLGDPARIAEVILRLAEHDDPPVHLFIGSDAVSSYAQVEAARSAVAERWRKISESTDLAARGAIPAFPSAGTVR